jgi:hypothetical protein
MTLPTYIGPHRRAAIADSSADLARTCNWPVGTKLVGTDGATLQHATITAVGRDLVLATVDGYGEQLIDLRYRRWRIATDTQLLIDVASHPTP